MSDVDGWQRKSWMVSDLCGMPFSLRRNLKQKCEIMSVALLNAVAMLLGLFARTETKTSQHAERFRVAHDEQWCRHRTKICWIQGSAVGVPSMVDPGNEIPGSD
jgi:hypothetical protein